MSWQKEKVLVTGGTGFLGANLIHLLVRDMGVPAAAIRSLADRPSRALDDLPGIEQRFGDILDPGAAADACADCTVVFHAAGSTTFDPRQRRRQWLVNVEGTRSLLEAARASGTVRRLCHTSTVNVLGCPSPAGSVGTEETCNPYHGTSRLHSFASAAEALAFADAVHDGSAPRGWWKRLLIGYHDSKLAAQELVNRAAREQGLDVVSVLPGTFFGAYGELCGPSSFLLGVMRNRVPGVPAGGLPLAHVYDVARGHVLVAEKGRRGAMYIISGKLEDNRSFSDMMRIIAEVVREKEPQRRIRSSFPVLPSAAVWIAAGLAEAGSALSGRPTTVSRQALRAARHPSFYSSERAERELGYRAENSFREGVSEMYDYLEGRKRLS
jgi:dihydroflavonol-4-reductase